MNKPLHIFRAGKHAPMNGAAIDFSDTDLKAVAANYDPASYEAPIVIGHPTLNGPAWGWVSGVSFSDGDLYADAGQVDADFAEAVAQGRYKKISASFFTPNSPNNPSPGHYHLRHVGFLGATAPAVKGLDIPSFSDKPVSFSEDDVVITVEFSDSTAWGLQSIARMFTNLREFLIQENGKEVADDILPNYQIEGLENLAQDERADTAPAFADQEEPETTPAKVPSPEPTPNPKEDDMNQKEKDALAQGTAALAEGNADLAKKEADHDKNVAAFAQKQNLADANTFITSLGGKILPGEVEGLASFMASVGDGDTISFGDNEGKPAMEFFKEFLTALPDRVDFAERTNKDGDAVDFSDSNDVAKSITAHVDAAAKEGRSISVSQAAAELDLPVTS